MFKQNFLKYFITSISLLVILISCATKNNKSDSSSVDWSKMDDILNSVKEPVFKNKTYSILDFGAVADGGKASKSETRIFAKYGDEIPLTANLVF